MSTSLNQYFEHVTHTRHFLNIGHEDDSKMMKGSGSQPTQVGSWGLFRVLGDLGQVLSTPGFHVPPHSMGETMPPALELRGED